MQDLGCHPTGVSRSGAPESTAAPPPPLLTSTRDGKVGAMALGQGLCKDRAQSSAKSVSDQGFWPCHSLVP